jgi:1-acyl-sn-glycerol-3-phosphate acyltransferase
MKTSATACREQLFERAPDFIERLRPLVKLVNGYFATEYRGWQHVPDDGPCLIVGNHSGGAAPNDFAFLLHKWIEERGAEAPLYALAYDALFEVPVLSRALRRLGVIPANHDNGRKALASGALVSVFPGGDYEVFRPWSERNRIDFGGHMGFVRLAIQSRVPVVPMTIHGAHESTFVLTRGRRLARAMGLGRLHIQVFPLIWNIPFGLTPASVPSVQLPSKVTVHFGAPLDWSHYRPRQADDPEVLRACYDEITHRMQKTLTHLASQHPYPVLERLGPSGGRRGAASAKRGPRSVRDARLERPRLVAHHDQARHARHAVHAVAGS